MRQTLARIEVGAKRALNGLAWSRWLAAPFLVALCLALYLPGFASLPVTDRDEARFAQATKQMLEGGGYVDIRFQTEPRYKKPIGIYWLQALSVSQLSPGRLTEIWAYRVPSLIGIIAAVLFTWWAARPIFGRETALLAAILLASAFTLSLEARIAKSDAVLLAAIALAQGALARIYLLGRAGQRKAGIAAVFWVALGLGILVKGPVAPGLALLTAIPLLIFDRDRTWLRNLRAAWGVPLMLAITLPWFIAIGVTSDWEFFRLAFGEDFLGKIQGGKEKHWGPPGFYFITFWWSFWPAALVATGGAALWLWRNRMRRRALLLLAWIIPFWLALEVTPTKLPHYAMVFYPAIAIGSAWVLREAVFSAELRQRTYRHGAALWLLIAVLQLAVLGFGLIYFRVMPPVWFWPLAAGVAAFALLTMKAAWNGQFHAAITTAIITAAMLYMAAFRFVLPSLDSLWMSRQAAEIVGGLRACAPGTVVLTRYREPSAIFHLGTATQLASVEDAAEAVRTGKAAYALVPTENGRLASGATPPRPVACVNGFNINGGKHLQMQIITSKPAETLAACPVPERYRCGD